MLDTFEESCKRLVGHIILQCEACPFLDQFEILDSNSLRRGVVLDHHVRRPICYPHPDRVVLCYPGLLLRRKVDASILRLLIYISLGPFAEPFINDTRESVLLEDSNGLVDNRDQFRPIVTDVTDHFKGVLFDQINLVNRSLQGLFAPMIIAHPGDNDVDLFREQGLGHGLMVVIRFDDGRRKFFQTGSRRASSPFVSNAHAIQI